AGGTISGTGLVSAGTGINGNGTVAISISGRSVTASGGVLDVTGSMDAATQFAIDADAKLKLDNAGSPIIAPVTIDSSSKTLEIAKSTTINAAQSITGGNLVVDSGAVLTDTSGIVLSNGTLSGAGSLSSSTNVSGYGTLALSFT